MNEKQGTALPVGAMVEVGINQLDEGRFVQDIDAAIRKVHKTLCDMRLTTGTIPAGGSVTVKLNIAYDKDVSDYVSIMGRIQTSTPAHAAKSLVREKAGHLLCQLGGADAKSPDQMRIFHPDGRAAGVLDTGTGAMVDPAAAVPDVAGRIAAGG